MAYLLPQVAMGRNLRTVAGAPVAGTSEVQTMTIGTTPTGGTFKLAFKGQITAPITWSATTGTLIANIDAALGALTTIGGASNVTTADVNLSGGAGTLTVTFAGSLAKLDVPLITVNSNDLVGAGATLAIAATTPGVTATHRGAPKGALLSDTDNGIWYQNTGTVYVPVWTAVDVASVSQEMINLAAAIPTAAVVTVAGLGIAIAAANATTVAEANAPAGGTGATEGAYDTAAHRDTAIALINSLKAQVNVLITEATELKLDIGTLSTTTVENKTQLNALLVALRTAGIVTP